MKRETLQKRIEKHLYTKKGTLAKKYEDVFYLLMHPEEVMRPVYWSNRGRSLHDSSANLEEGLKLLGIDFETGNDAPRGGRDGYYIKLSKKGKRQVSEFSKVLIIHKGVTEIGNWAFSGCRCLASVTIPDSVKRIGDFAFYACDRLQSVTIPQGCQYDERAFDKGTEVIIR